MKTLFYNSSASDDKEEREETLALIVKKAGLQPCEEWTGGRKDLSGAVREDADCSFLLFLHCTDWQPDEAVRAISSAGEWPENCYVIFYSGGGLAGQRSDNPRVKFLEAMFPAGVTEDSFYFKQLVAAVKAVAAAEEQRLHGTAVGADFVSFEEIDINNPPYAQVLQKWLALDILIQGALKLREQGRKIRKDWFDDVRPEFAEKNKDFPVNPSKKSQINHSLKGSSLEKLVGAFRPPDGQGEVHVELLTDGEITAELITDTALSEAHGTFKEIAEALCRE